MTDESTWSRFRTAVARRVGVDARALAALRVALGVLLLADLAFRARHLVAFYTNRGVLPVAALRGEYAAFAEFSLHAAGGVGVQAALFALAAVAALAVLAGYHTRLAVVASLVLLASLHARNPVVLSAGDSLLRRLLLWSVFLPLGARWSVDARRGARRDGHVASAATAGLLVQVVVVYAVNAVVKLRGDAWLGGDAIRYVFGLGGYTTAFGAVLADFPAVLGALSHGWLALLVASPLLLVVVGRARTALAAAFAVAHLGMAATMHLGLFPFISAAALIPLFPPAVWDRLPEPSRSPTAVLDDVLPAVSAPRGVSAPGLRRTVSVAGRALAAALLVGVLVWNAAALGYADVPGASGVDPGEHRWDMFAPEPRHAYVEYDATGTLASGERVDPMARGFDGMRWRTYLFTLQQPGSEALADDFAGYLCERDGRLASVDVDYVEYTVRLDAPDEGVRRDLVEQSCPGTG
ncbi:HTTM domain-containing protein [Halobacterium litoreum]|uniref:HTTM domain-containing protein n=1 Tax=Halobacterium litoreum TaxID=2039234 RepID=A0ABD5NG51_9EURY|nr:HTTM domain-containing protein [Halobacterium litoreum]UHH12888.1 HTTM domain-containing protein [Halobacterium litoreum]